MNKKNLYEEMRFFSEVNFREIYKRFIYIHCREALEKLLPGELDDAITGIIAYCYIDKDQGISFRPVLLATLAGLSIKVFTFPHQEDTIYIFRLREGVGTMNEYHNENRHMLLYTLDPVKNSFIDMSVLNFQGEDFTAFKEMIDTTYDAGSEVENLRSKKYEFLDPFRNELFPDDVRVLLYSKENGVEQVWVRLILTHGKEFFGLLLNEPYQDYGCHKGTIIGFVLTKSGEKSVLIFNGRTAVIKKE